MRKIAGLIFSICVLSVSGVHAQSEIDAYKLSETDVTGTARSLSMGGAFGALGGDISSMYTNPAGLGIYRSSEFVTTLSLNFFNTNSDWKGAGLTGNKTRFNLDNFAYVGYFPTGNDEGVVGWNVGVSYNKLKNFNRQYSLNGFQRSNMSQYTAAISEGIPVKDLTETNRYNPYYNSDHPWLPILSFQAGFIFPDGDSSYGAVYPNSPESTYLQVREWGGVDQYNFSFATNISNVFFIGATLGVTDIKYRMASYYDEQYGGRDKLYLNNNLTTDGTGYNLKLGVIARPADFLRLGVAYNSPTWYKMTDFFLGAGGTYVESPGNPDDPNKIENSTPSNSSYDYKLRTPDKWIFSAAAILGQNALISVDYELTNYKNTRLYDIDGYEFTYENEDIRSHAQNMHAIKVGAEYKVTPQFALRAGGGWQSSYAKSVLQNNEEQVYTAGTIPHFNVDKGTTSLSVGFGYRFTPHFYMDMAYVYKQRKENAYTFSSIYNNTSFTDVRSEAASLKTNTSRVALTFGYKF